MKAITFIVSIIVYLIGTGGLFYIILWMGGCVPPSINAEATGPVSTAILVNLGLLILFSIQHSGMARKSFKEKASSIIPAYFERSVYVMVSGVLCAAIAGCKQEGTITVQLEASYHDVRIRILSPFLAYFDPYRTRKV